MPAHVVYGDTFLVARRLEEIRTRAGAGDLMESNRLRVVAAQAQPAEVLAMCYSMPFLEPIRFIEIEGAVATQEPSGGGRGAAATRGRANRRGGANPGGWMQLVEPIPQFPDSTVLVFIDSALSDRNPLLRALSEHATIHRENAPTGANLDRWIKQAAEQKGASIAPPAIRALSDMVGNDLWALDRELEKLALYAGNRGINESDARTLVSHAQETNIFTAVDAIVDGRPGEAHRLLAQLMDEGREPQYLIAMIERQLRLIALARDLSDRSVAPAEMGRRMGTSSDFVVRKTLGQARRTPLSDISRMYQRVLRSDLDIKTGRLDPAVSLELLVADLTGLP